MNPSERTVGTIPPSKRSPVSQVWVEVFCDLRTLSTSSTIWLLGLSSLGLNLIAILGTAKSLSELVPGTEEINYADLASLGFASLLFGAVYMVTQVTTEFQNGLYIGSFTRLRSAGMMQFRHTMTALTVGMFFGIVGGFSGWLGATVADARSAWHFGQDPDKVKVFIGVMAVCTVSAVLGSSLGWMIRQPSVAVTILLLWQLAIEGGIATLTPHLYRWLPGGAQSAIYSDPNTQHFGPLAGLGILTLWILALYGYARTLEFPVRLFRKKFGGKASQ